MVCQRATHPSFGFPWCCCAVCAVPCQALMNSRGVQRERDIDLLLLVHAAEVTQRAGGWPGSSEGQGVRRAHPQDRHRLGDT